MRKGPTIPPVLAVVVIAAFLAVVLVYGWRAANPRPSENAREHKAALEKRYHLPPGALGN